MMRFFISICLFFGTLTSVAQSVKFDQTTFNFGKIEESGGMVSCTFDFVNSSSQPLVIVDVAVTCGCTTPRFKRDALAPGQRGQITVEFDPMNRPGRIDKQIVVVTNDGNYKLHLDGIVNARPRSLEERYPFALSGGARLDGLGFYSLQVPINKEVEVEIGVANGGSGVPVTIGVDRSKLPAGVVARVDNELVAAGGETKIKVTVKGGQYGLFSYRLPLLINGRLTAENVTIGGAVVDDFSKMSDDELEKSARAKFSTFYYRFGNVKAGARVNGVVEISNIGGAPLIIRGVEGSSQLEAKVEKMVVPVGGVIKLNISYLQKQSGYDSGFIRLIVNDPRNPTPEIRFVATVSPQ